MVVVQRKANCAILREKPSVPPVDVAMPPHDVARETLERSLPLYLSPVVAGFPTPAEDYLDRKLDLHEHLVQNHATTFFCEPPGLR